MADILLVGEDPGGVDVIVPIRKRLDLLGVRSQVLSGGPGNPVWQRHGIPFDDITGSIAASSEDSARVRGIIKSYQPRVLVTATSYPRRIEKVFRREARALGIPSAAVLDADRTDLYRTEPDEMACRPDLVVSIGPRMTTQLVAAGYDAAKVITTGHLALAEIAATGRSIPDAEIAEWKQSFMETSDDRELLVIYSDNITQVFGASGALAEVGYHERIVVPALLRAITKTADRHGRRYEVVVKLHPKESPGAFDAVFRELECDRLHIREIAACDNLRLIRASDYIFGMYSIVMVWSALLGALTLSYQPDALKDNLLVTVHEGAAPCCWHAAELDRMVESFLTDEQWRQAWRKRLAAWRPGPLDGVGHVTERVLKLARLASHDLGA
jgi:hypothetical protein